MLGDFFIFVKIWFDEIKECGKSCQENENTVIYVEIVYYGIFFVILSKIER